MKRIGLALCMASIATMGGCGEVGAPDTEITGEAVDRSPSIPDNSGRPAAAIIATEGAPEFAAVYPGGVVDGAPVAGTVEDASGGLVTYLTEAAPETVIAFHRERAEAAGLTSVMAMNQGEARAYGAATDQNNLQVVASPTPDGRTSVQLSWSAAS